MSIQPAIACLDLEGVLIPEIWIGVAEKTKIAELRVTTREEPNYDLLMKRRLKILDEHKVTLKDIQAVIIAIATRHAGRFFVFCGVDPRWGADGLALFEKSISSHHFHGLKLYPPIQRFYPNDRALYPIYEVAAEHHLPILFHFGITIGTFYDLSYASPLPLSAPVKEFPEVTFTIAHFGAGFFRETLFLAYHTDNVCVDTSGTNNWREYYPGAPSLEQIFRDALRAFGPKRILFGTDSTIWGGYRHHILKEQVEILNRLELSPQDRSAILTENALRLLRPT